MKIIYRRALPDDYQGVVALFRELGPRYVCDADRSDAKGLFCRYVDSAEKIGFVAWDEDEGEIAGVILLEVCAVFSPTLRHLRADGMVVAPAYRGNGISNALLACAFEHAVQIEATSFMAKASKPEVIEQYRRNPKLKERGVYFYFDPLDTDGSGPRSVA